MSKRIARNSNIYATKRTCNHLKCIKTKAGTYVVNPFCCCCCFPKGSKMIYVAHCCSDPIIFSISHRQAYVRSLQFKLNHDFRANLRSISRILMSKHSKVEKKFNLKSLISVPSVLLSAWATLAILTLGIQVQLPRMWQLGNQPVSRVQRSTASINHTRHEKCATIYPKCDKMKIAEFVFVN